MDTETQTIRKAENEIAKVMTRPDQSCLEAGCGSARWIKIPPCNVSGIDISQIQLDLNKHYAQKILGDIETYDVGRDQYDLIISWDVFEHLENPDKALANLAPALKPGGLILLKAPLPSSLFGWLTRLTPTWFHRAAYRFVLGHKDVRVFDPRKDVAPFKTLYRRAMFPKALKAQAAALGLQTVTYLTYEIDMQKNVREQNRFFAIVLSPIKGLSHLLFRDDRLFVSSFILILQRPAASTD